ncbi:MAG: glutathione S-transferase [Pseudomonadota bacterium]
MTYRLYIMDRAYSSWSLRGFLALEAFGLPFQVTHAHWSSPEWDALKAEIAPGRTVPALKTSDGVLLWDSLAIVETLVEENPDAGLLPKDAAARAAARSITAEMHGGFSALRSECPMNLRRQYLNFEASDAVVADIARIEELWSWARTFAEDGPFLFGAYSAADVFYTPIASRLATYGLTVSDEAAAYIDAVHRVPAFRRWRAMANATPRLNPDYEFDFELKDGIGPGAEPLPARSVEGVQSINANCPYSGKPVAENSLAEIDGVVIGYCNQFCRDKSVADAEAWPATVELLRG